MSKIIVNTTVADIAISAAGTTMPASANYTLSTTEYLQWADPDVLAELNVHLLTGDLVVNDGTVNLSAADGIAFIAYPDLASNVLFDDTTTDIVGNTTQKAIEYVRTLIATGGSDHHSGQDLITTGVTLIIVANKQSTITGRLTIEGTGRLEILGRMNIL